MNKICKPYWYPWPALEFVPAALIPEHSDVELESPVAKGRPVKVRQAPHDMDCPPKRRP